MLTRSIKIAILAGVVLCLAGCLTDQVAEDGTVVDVTPAGPDPSTYVCNPMDGDSGIVDRTQGVLGKLFYVPEGGTVYNTAAEYIANATPVDVDIYFNQLFVPTRPFDRGFVTQSGITLTAGDGVTTLYEWFGISYKGNLQLGPTDAPGAYQLAILSDDGSMMYVGPEGSQSLVVNNDGWHSTRMGCATAPINLAAGEKLPFTLDYFQGPRFHISLVLMWRPWPTNPADETDPLCGSAGNSFWFDSTQDPPAPTANYDALLARGWKVVAPENLSLPGEAEENPCNEPAPVLSAVTISGVQRNQITVSWTTDRPATSQVVYTDAATGAVSSTPATTTLVTNHNVVVTGLTANTLYRVKGVSQSSSGRSAESAEVTLRTAR